MGYSLNIRNFRLPGVEQSSIREDQVTYFSVIELPYRLRLGRYFRHSMDTDGTVEIACLNRVNVPKLSRSIPDEAIEDLPRVRNRHLLNTRLVVIENTIPIKKEEMEQIRQAQPFSLTTEADHLLKQDPGSQLMTFPYRQTSLAAIQRFIDLYHVYCPPNSGGDMVRPVWLHDYLSLSIVFGVCLRLSNIFLPDSFVKALLRSDNLRWEEKDTQALFLQDALPAQKRRFVKSLRVGEQPTFANQLLLLSHSYLQQHNMEMALITAVAALEAALFVFAQKRLEPIMGGSLTDSFLREQGASMLIEALPLLLFSKKNMPNADLFKTVKKAMSARNSIMHGKLDGSGKPKHLNAGYLGPLIYACKEMIEAFQREA